MFLEQKLDNLKYFWLIFNIFKYILKIFFYM